MPTISHAAFCFLVLFPLLQPAGISAEPTRSSDSYQTAGALISPGQSWKKPTGGRVISLAVSPRHGWIYALSEDRTLHCMNRYGALLWQSERLPYRPVGTAAVGPDESIYVHTTHGDLFAFNPAGRIIWSVGLSGSIAGEICTAPDGMLYYITSAGVAAARTHLGTLVWKRKLEAAPATSLRYDGNYLLSVVLENGTIILMDTSGRLRTEFRISDGSAGLEARPETIQAESTDIRFDSSGIYTVSNGTVSRYERNGGIIWSVGTASDERQNAVKSGFTLCADTVVTAGSGGRISVLDRETGGEVSSIRTGIPIDYLYASESDPMTLFASGDRGTAVLDLRKGTVVERIPSPVPGGRPLVFGTDLFVGGDDWVVYRYSTGPGIEVKTHERDASRRSFAADERIKGPKEVYTVEILTQPGRDEYLEMLDLLEKDLSSLEPRSGFHDSLATAELLAGTGVLNPMFEAGYLINDFPDIRVRSIELLGRYGSLDSLNILLSLLRYDWDPVVSGRIITALGNLRSDPDGEVVNTMRHLLHSGVIPVSREPGIAAALIESVDSICRYSGVVRPAASQLLNDLYFADIPRELRQNAIDTLRAFQKKK